MDAAKLIDYTHAARRRYLRTIRDMPWDEVVRDRGTSFSSIRDIFLHTLGMEDRLIDLAIAGKTEPWTYQHDYEKFMDIKAIEERVNEVEKKTKKYIEGLTPQELKKKVHMPRRTNPPIVMTVEDILLQITIEAASHMGELIAVMWQQDIQPPFLNWASFLEEAPNFP
jgi:uncharacterized damage-inducible protein DinB